MGVRSRFLDNRIPTKVSDGSRYWVPETRRRGAWPTLLRFFLQVGYPQVLQAGDGFLAPPVSLGSLDVAESGVGIRVVEQTSSPVNVPAGREMMHGRRTRTEIAQSKLGNVGLGLIGMLAIPLRNAGVGARPEPSCGFLHGRIGRNSEGSRSSFWCQKQSVAVFGLNERQERLGEFQEKVN